MAFDIFVIAWMQPSQRGAIEDTSKTLYQPINIEFEETCIEPSQYVLLEQIVRFVLGPKRGDELLDVLEAHGVKPTGLWPVLGATQLCQLPDVPRLLHSHMLSRKT